MLKKKKPAFIVVEREKFSHIVFFKKLPDKFPADSTTGTGNQDAFFS